MSFPAAQAIGDRHYTHTQTWEWTGSEWVQVYGVDDSSILRTNPDEPTGQFIGLSAEALAGHQIIADTPAENDLLRYNNGAWRNTMQTHITDGGHF